jgi:hypothetical protein
MVLAACLFITGNLSTVEVITTMNIGYWSGSNIWKWTVVLIGNWIYDPPMWSSWRNRYTWSVNQFAIFCILSFCQHPENSLCSAKPIELEKNHGQIHSSYGSLHRDLGRCCSRLLCFGSI